MKAKKFNIEGKETGTVEVSDALAEATAPAQSIKDYIVAMRKNRRQWSACTRTRKEVNHSNQKPHKQKGLGRARQGSLASPQYKGGGVVFGPRPKSNQHVRINRKQRRQAIKALMGERIREERFLVLEDPSFDAPKTKRMVDFLKNAGLEGRILFLGKESGHFAKSISNMQKVNFTLVGNVNGYDLALARYVIVTESALEELVA